MDESDIGALERLLVQMATVAQALDRRSELAVAHVEAGTVALGQGAQVLSDGTERLVRETTRAIGEAAHQAVVQGAGSALDGFIRQLRLSAGIAHAAALALEEQRNRLVAARHTVLWKALGALLIGSLLALGTVSYIGWNAAREVRDAHFAQDIMRATQGGTLTRCGAELCVRVGTQIRRYGKNPAYVLIAE